MIRPGKTNRRINTMETGREGDHKGGIIMIGILNSIETTGIEIGIIIIMTMIITTIEIGGITMMRTMNIIMMIIIGTSGIEIIMAIPIGIGMYYMSV